MRCVGGEGDLFGGVRPLHSIAGEKLIFKIGDISLQSVHDAVPFCVATHFSSALFPRAGSYSGTNDLFPTIVTRHNGQTVTCWMHSMQKAA